MGRYDYDDEEPYVIIEKHSGSVGSLLMGVAIGAGLALLFAPQSGQDTRRGLERGARRARVRAVRLADEVKGTVADTIDQARSQVEQRIDDARHTVELRKQQVARAVEAGRAAAHQARTELERRIAEGKAAYEAGVAAARAQTAGAAAA
ncbi:MAG TPA: YtxH domain-containing protein, partial [Gemmatimonadales bacterium]